MKKYVEFVFYVTVFYVTHTIILQVKIVQIEKIFFKTYVEVKFNQDSNETLFSKNNILGSKN